MNENLSCRGSLTKMSWVSIMHVQLPCIASRERAKQSTAKRSATSRWPAVLVALCEA